MGRAKERATVRGGCKKGDKTANNTTKNKKRKLHRRLLLVVVVRGRYEHLQIKERARVTLTRKTTRMNSVTVERRRKRQKRRGRKRVKRKKRR